MNTEESLQEIEQYFKQVKAIKNYPSLKKEKEELERKIKESKETIQEEKKRVKELEKEKERLKEKLKEKKAEKKKAEEKLEEKLEQKNEKIKNLKKEKKKETEKLRKKIEAREEEITSLRQFKYQNGTPLPEAKEKFLKEKKKEIERRAQEKFQERIQEWREEEKYGEIRKATILCLKKGLEEGKWLEGSRKAGIPEKVNEIIDEKVQERIDETFLKAVEVKAEEKAEKKLKEKLNKKWPEWFQGNVIPKIKKVMDTTYRITCDKCGEKQEFHPTPEQIEDLLTSGETSIKCANPDCKDLLGRHSINLQLRNLIKAA